MNIEVFKEGKYKMILDNDIIFINYLTDTISYELVEEVIKEKLIYIDISKKYKMIADVTKVRVFPREARQRIAQQDSIIGVSYCGLIIASRIQRVFFNMFLKTQKPLVPTKIFQNYTSAVDWLNTCPN